LSIRVEEDKCIGCGLCALVCSLAHGGLAALASAQGFAATLPPARVTVRPREESAGSPASERAPGNFAAGAFRIDICRHCEDPVCATGCVSGAISVDREAGLVILDRVRCVGCWTCVMECPFGAVSMTADTGGEEPARRALKCDGCVGIGAPQCTRFCPTAALSGGGRYDLVTAGRRRAHVQRRGEAGGGDAR
jgi:anaerobic carbon-monoxide dehydrogenase iron sulfur subunit